MDALKLIAADSVKKDLPSFEIGDTVRVSVNIKEGERERIQMFEGTVIARKGSGVAETFTVRPGFLRRRRGESLPGPLPQRKGRNGCPQGPCAQSPSCTICVTALARLPRSRSRIR